ncbi:hypothetical protein Fmac_017541 [Flemingia macrophylla]|uniref:Transmembrane protein n=1 Tax=Flemingia macrophylla TaxID=520843 RepID=A0ABD1M491_9FABA
MPHSRFLSLLLLSSLLFLSFHHGFGRVAHMEIEDEDDVVPLREINVPFRTTVKYEIADYADPQPNINPKNGYIFSPPSPTPTPTHPPSP